MFIKKQKIAIKSDQWSEIRRNYSNRSIYL